jgi:16S rRNA (cytosine967-C5)-methyltransferase
MFVQAYLSTAEEILTQYGGEEPFHSFLKKYFSSNKKFGSRDRKHITHLCYCFFRVGKSLGNISFLEKLSVALFLCSMHRNLLLQKMHPDFNEDVEKPLDRKLEKIKINYDFQAVDIFPFQEFLSDLIPNYDFSCSFLIQPLTYLRIRPGNEKEVKEKLTQADIPFQIVNDNCIAVEPATRLDGVLEMNREVVIQDISSQNVLGSLINYRGEKQIEIAWDCCAGSGGKSILLKDFFPQVQLTVSDIRESILINLKKRLAQAGIQHYKKIVIDIASAPLNKDQKFDLIICDAPCSGSGTWSRTPEQLYFFNENKIDQYAALQKKIVGNAVKSLEKDGFFLYVTCSVFKKENEEIVQFLENELSLHLIRAEYLKGYHQKADTLFSALFTL